MIYYHYTTGTGLFGILNSNELNCSNINFLNDPTELKHFNIILEELFIANPEYKSIYSKLFWEDFDGNFCPQFYYIASFSKKSDSLHMWNYYANGNGYNIGIDIDSIININKKNVESIRKIDMIYNIAEQKEILEKLFISYREKLKSIESIKLKDKEEEEYTFQIGITELSMSFTDEVTDKIITFKHPAYRHEEETRLIIGIKVEDYDKINYFVSKTGVFIEYTSLSLNLLKNLKSVTIHPGSNDLHVSGLKRFIGSKIDIFGKIPVYPSKVPFRVI